MESVFPSFFFNTKSSSLLEDEHHVAVGSQNISKPRALINSKNLQHSSTHTISKRGVANREGSRAQPALLGTSHTPAALPLWCLLEQGRGASPRLLGPQICRGERGAEWERERELGWLLCVPRAAAGQTGCMCHKHAPSHGSLLLPAHYRQLFLALARPVSFTRENYEFELLELALVRAQMLCRCLLLNFWRCKTLSCHPNNSV